MHYYICAECSKESPLPAEKLGGGFKCPHCAMLGMAYGVSVREVPDADPPFSQSQPPAVPPPAPQPEAPPAEPSPPSVESPPKRRQSGPGAPQPRIAPWPGPSQPAQPAAPVIEPVPPPLPRARREHQPNAQRVSVRRADHPTPVPLTPPLDKLAVASMFLGLASIGLACACGIGAVLGVAAVITGLISLRRLSMRPIPLSGRGAAMAGIILGAIGLVVAAVVLLGSAPV